jgi:hypothetical protein
MAGLRGEHNAQRRHQTTRPQNPSAPSVPDRLLPWPALGEAHHGRCDYGEVVAGGGGLLGLWQLRDPGRSPVEVGERVDVPGEQIDCRAVALSSLQEAVDEDQCSAANQQPLFP